MSVVSVQRSGAVATILVDSPPVNALSFAVREGLLDALRDLVADDAVKALVLRCAGRTFFAGADIAEFEQPQKAPDLRVVMAMLNAYPKPIVAAVHGSALGGGFELALGCSYRVAIASARFGLPEIKLGLMPGARGTQLLPRATGVQAAAKLMLSGESITAEAAHAAGVVDEVVADLDEAVAFARNTASRRPIPRLSEQVLKSSDLAALDELEKAMPAKVRASPSTAAILASLRDTIDVPFEAAIVHEAEAFDRLLATPESAAQRYFFKAERNAAKLPGTATSASPVRRAGVIGAGLMGGGIAMCFANAGIPVTIIDTKQDTLDRGIAAIRANYERTAKRGGLTPGQVEDRMALISASLDSSALADADIVTEAIFENMALKKQIFADLGQVTRADAILASNTSTLDLDQIAAVTRNPERVVGMHYFSPANVMKLMEVVRGAQSAPGAIATAFDLARKLKKVPVLSGVCFGFIGNRMLEQRGIEAEHLLMEGCSPAEIDKPVIEFGFPMGQCGMSDLAGLDVGYRIRKERGTRLEIADRLFEAGRLGQKSNTGYFRYEPGNRTPIPDPVVDALIAEVRGQSDAGAERRRLSSEEIFDRLNLPMVNEAARILEEGIAIRASDIDVVWVYGYGWPVLRGGPMYWADRIGLATIRDKLAAHYDATGKPAWKPAALIERLAAQGRGFADYAAAA